MTDYRIPTRFEALLVQSNIFDVLLSQQKKITGTNQSLKYVPPAAKEAQVLGSVPQDSQFDGRLEFAIANPYIDAGADFASFTEPLVAPKVGIEYYIRCVISQHAVNPLLQGFKTVWTLPAGWSWVDGHADTLYDEAISNPLYVNRVALCGSARSVGFKVVIDKKYLP